MPRALITSGGGAKGAFTVGALKTLEKYQYGDFDIISGTSTGALIAALAAVKQYDTLAHEYTHVDDEDVLQQGNIFKNINLGRPYFYDTLPLERKIDQYITDAVYQQIVATQKYVCFTAISLQSGRRTIFTTRAFSPQRDYDVVVITSGSMLRDAILASTNQAAFLKPVTIVVGGQRQQFVDGGNRDILPVRPALDLGATAIFALSNNPRELMAESEQYTDLLKVLFRTLSIFIQDVRDNDYAQLEAFTGRKVLIQPETELDRNNPTGLNFDKVNMIRWMRNGELVAEKILNANGLIPPAPQV